MNSEEVLERINHYTLVLGSIAGTSAYEQARRYAIANRLIALLEVCNPRMEQSPLQRLQLEMYDIISRYFAALEG